MKKKGLALLMLVALPFLGMGTTGSCPPGEVPKAAKNYNVSVVDDTGTKTDGNNFTSDGKLYFEGKKGDTKVSVPFERTREVSVEKKSEAKAAVTATLADGSTVAFDMECKDHISGNTYFGSFTVDMCNVRKISFK